MHSAVDNGPTDPLKQLLAHQTWQDVVPPQEGNPPKNTAQD
jgi:hypothetical protein